MPEMNPTQKKLLEMLKWFHGFCVENNLRYYVLEGTMLGAARHQGFIPWDDDLDVGLPRRDYERLIKLMESRPSLQYLMETPYSLNKDYTYPFSKIYDSETTLIENKRTAVVRGIYIDIFPLDGLGNSYDECKVNYAKINRRYNILLASVGGIRKGRSAIKNAAVVAFRCIPKSVLNAKNQLEKLDRLCAQIDFDSSLWICSDVGAWRLKEAVPREVMGTPTLYTFEDTVVYGAENADAYLTSVYGNWRELPPPERRVSHHDYISLDLNTSYLDMKATSSTQSDLKNS